MDLLQRKTEDPFSVKPNITLQNHSDHKVINSAGDHADGDRYHEKTVKQLIAFFFFRGGTRIREPPEENGLMALDWAPRIVQANNTGALKPTEAARFGISGNNAGATTPVVELKKLMMAPTRQKAIGTRGFGTLEPIQVESASMVPASTATAISIPAPAIMIIVFQGMRAMASF